MGPLGAVGIVMLIGLCRGDVRIVVSRFARNGKDGLVDFMV
jgi:hypothetical protein